MAYILLPLLTAYEVLGDNRYIVRTANLYTAALFLSTSRARAEEDQYHIVFEVKEY